MERMTETELKQLRDLQAKQKRVQRAEAEGKASGNEPGGTAGASGRKRNAGEAAPGH